MGDRGMSEKKVLFAAGLIGTMLGSFFATVLVQIVWRWMER